MNFKAAKGKDFYVNVEKQKLKNILSNPSKNKKGNLSFLNYLHECIKSFDIGSDDDLPETFRRLLPTNNQTKENIEIFPMFFNKYEYEDASNNYSLETIDYRIAEEKYDPSEKQYFRKRLLCFSSSSAAYSDIDEKAREYIGNLIQQIQSKGEKYDPEAPDEDLEKQLKQHTRDLNTMLTLYNFHDATAVRTCALLFYIVATSFSVAKDLQNDKLKNDLNNWNKSTKINAAALLKLFCNDKVVEEKLDTMLKKAIACWWTDTQKKADVNFTPADIQQAVEGKNLFGLMPIKKYEEPPSTAAISNSNNTKNNEFGYDFRKN